MGRLGLVWKILTDGTLAQRVAGFLQQPAIAPETTPKEKKPAAIAAETPPAPRPSRSDALSLLSALQREARLIDFLKEPIDGYSDAQVGAAVRDIHRDCAAVLERQFAIRPVLQQPEGSPVSIQNHSASQIRLVGKTEARASSGTLVHHGWQSTRCEVPVWSGDADASTILAPAEVEVR